MENLLLLSFIIIITGNSQLWNIRIRSKQTFLINNRRNVQTLFNKLNKYLFMDDK